MDFGNVIDEEDYGGTVFVVEGLRGIYTYGIGLGDFSNGFEEFDFDSQVVRECFNVKTKGVGQ